MGQHGVLTAGALTFGILASRESHALSIGEGSFPASATAGPRRGVTTAYSILADSLTAGALLVGGITLVSTLLSGPSAPHAEARASRRIGLGPGLRVDGTF